VKTFRVRLAPFSVPYNALDAQEKPAEPAQGEAMEHTALYDAIQKASDVLAANDGRIEDEHRALVAGLIERCEIAAMNTDAEFGPWERRELGLARAAHAAGWLRLALTAAHKALQVSELPRDQYDYGWTYSQHQIKKSAD
jgi:hypothetical protein